MYIQYCGPVSNFKPVSYVWFRKLCTDWNTVLSKPECLKQERGGLGCVIACPLYWNQKRKKEKQRERERKTMEERQHDVWGQAGAAINISSATLPAFSRGR